MEASNRDNLVNVIIPIYRPTLSQTDRISLSQTCRVLGRYPLTVVHPKSMDTGEIAREFPQLRFKAFDDDYFASIVGYNRLMLSETFYSAFSDYRYILIAQLDVYIFRDELEEWCLKGYDYVGAPWLKRSIYTWPIIKQMISCYKYLQHGRGRLTRFERYGRVGNGGLSLRRVESHLEVIRKQPQDVRRFAVTHNRKHLHNEDTFWAMMPYHFRYPSQEEAALFAFDKYPQLSLRLTHGQMPFGCHGWTKKKNLPFWEGIILGS